MYTYVWCRDCQYTMTADPKKVTKCPRCGSVKLGSLERNPVSVRKSEIISVQCQARGCEYSARGVISNILFSDKQSVCPYCGTPLWQGRRQERVADEILVPRHLLGTALVAIVYQGRVANVLIDDEQRECILDYISGAVGRVQRFVNSVLQMEKFRPPDVPSNDALQQNAELSADVTRAAKVKPSQSTSPAEELLIHGSVLGTPVKALVRDGEVLEIQMLTEGRQPTLFFTSAKSLQKVSSYVRDVLESRVIFKRIFKEPKPKAED